MRIVAPLRVGICDNERRFIVLALKSIPAQDDAEALAVLSRESPELQMEMAFDGSLLVSPVSEGGARELVAGRQLDAYAARLGGKSFGLPPDFV